MLAYGLWFRGIGRLSPVAVSAMSLLSPVTAVVFLPPPPDAPARAE
jgi:probable blue pigment (indigoidine) exporter